MKPSQANGNHCIALRGSAHLAIRNTLAKQFLNQRLIVEMEKVNGQVDQCYHGQIADRIGNFKSISLQRHRSMKSTHLSETNIVTTLKHHITNLSVLA
ncbi:hypothetical protein [Gimesia fumaroli]|uniref:hypothetical protein n=1 Tax=Gimesia fumaroli TaxID=2527976 RepID=UPI00119D7251|nr:hypothetical protein [Gimesia fumaroli]